MLRSIFLTLIIGFALDVFAWNYPENLLDIPFEGMGTQENPYIIGSAQDLCNLSWKVNNGFSYKDSYFKVTADIDLQSKEWIPIGSGGTSFQGYFEGDGHTISNLVVRSPKVYKYWSYYSYLYDYSIGLFGNIEEATITILTGFKNWTNTITR
ncbi:MAG: hypothetical protein K2O49_04610, partial [Muribaculaceae bacterium]|nr:hypothetical protein [Muribaculaceae bacterium]